MLPCKSDKQPGLSAKAVSFSHRRYLTAGKTAGAGFSNARSTTGAPRRTNSSTASIILVIPQPWQDCSAYSSGSVLRFPAKLIPSHSAMTLRKLLFHLVSQFPQKRLDILARPDARKADLELYPEVARTQKLRHGNGIFILVHKLRHTSVII